jgi:hypothetical protein
MDAEVVLSAMRVADDCTELPVEVLRGFQVVGNRQVRERQGSQLLVLSPESLGSCYSWVLLLACF